jgi:guanylate kinase
MYGTSIDSLQKVWAGGRICLLDIDVKGVIQLKQRPIVSAKYVFLMPPSAEELSSRLRGRHTESEADIALRLRNAEEEMAYGNSPGAFDVIEVNKEVESCVDAIVNSLKIWFPDRKW